MNQLINNISVLSIDTPNNGVEKCNKGVGAGGKQTNLNGKQWETDTCNVSCLKADGFINISGYLTKNCDSYDIIYFSQRELKRYFMDVHGIKTHRVPDEAYLIKKNDGTFVLKVLEKKFQNVDGSVMEKLVNYTMFIEEYKDMLETLNISISYAYCLSPFFKTVLDCDNKKMKAKFVTWNRCFKRDNVGIFYGGDIDYFEKLNSWIYDF